MAKRAKRAIENIVSNGDIVNRTDMNTKTFPVGTRFLLSNNTYHMEDFRVSEAKRDSGTDFRRMQSRMNDVVMPLTSLQLEYSKGNIKFLDAKGEIIEESIQK
jgi:hypothetical protein